MEKKQLLEELTLYYLLAREAVKDEKLESAKRLLFDLGLDGGVCYIIMSLYGSIQQVNESSWIDEYNMSYYGIWDKFPSRAVNKRELVRLLNVRINNLITEYGKGTTSK